MPDQTAPDGLPIYELGDPEAALGFAVFGGGYLIVRPPGDPIAIADGAEIPMSEFTLGRRYGPNGWVDQDADLPQAGSAWNWSIKIGDTDYE